MQAQVAKKASTTTLPTATLRSDRTKWILLFTVISVEILWAALSNAEQLYLVIPAIATLNVYLWFCMAIWRRERAFPVFDIGVFAMTAFLCYALIPVLGFLLAGMVFTPLSSFQLYYHSPSAEQLSWISWRYALFIGSFALFHFLVRARATANAGVTPPRKTFVISFLVVLFGLWIFFLILRVAYNVDFAGAYDTGLQERYDAFLTLPALLQQVANHLFQSFNIMQMGLVLLLIVYRRRKLARYALLVFLGGKVALSLFALGSLTIMAMPLVAFALLYHRLVRALPPRLVLTAGCAGILLLLTGGYLRAMVSQPEFLDHSGTVFEEYGRAMFSHITEFQTIFAGAYDLSTLKESGALEQVPWQVYAFELLSLFPEQILPSSKINPQDWYLSVTASPGYFFFNSICQAILGIDWLELILRGGGIGVVTALFHNWYVRNCQQFWVTLIYLFMVVISYYFVRSSTFSFLSWIVFQFIPVWLMVSFVNWVLSNMSRGHFSPNTQRSLP